MNYIWYVHCVHIQQKTCPTKGAGAQMHIPCCRQDVFGPRWACCPGVAMCGRMGVCPLVHSPRGGVHISSRFKCIQYTLRILIPSNYVKREVCWIESMTVTLLTKIPFIFICKDVKVWFSLWNSFKINVILNFMGYSPFELLSPEQPWHFSWPTYCSNTISFKNV